MKLHQRTKGQIMSNETTQTSLANEAFKRWLYKDDCEINTDGLSTEEIEAMRITWLACSQHYSQRIQEQENVIANLHIVMMAAAVEITEHWDSHCDSEGYGPSNLVSILENGFPEQYGYDAKTMVRMDKQITELQAQVNQLREALEVVNRLDYTHEHKAISEILIKALAATATQSLVRHDAEVIERCAKVAENMHKGWVTAEVAEAIRALKGTE